MTRFFKNSLLGILFLMVHSLQASCPTCPADYTTITATGTFVNFTICYPANVIVGENFNIYLFMHNTSLLFPEVGIWSFCPDCAAPPAFTPGTGVINVDSSPAHTAFNNTDTSMNNNGRGVFDYGSGIGTDATVCATITLMATSDGSCTYTPTATDASGLTTPFPSITINVITCPTITANTFTGCISGNLSGHVGGGVAPYNFFATGTQSGGTATVGSGGPYTFSNPIGSFQYQATDASGCLSSVGMVDINNPSPGTEALFLTTYPTPVVAALNFSGGTPPYTYSNIVTNNIASAVFDPSGSTVTITQTNPGASFLQYDVTDVNGCTFSPSLPYARIVVYSCTLAGTTSTGIVQSNDTMYVFCYPSTVYIGNIFDITTQIINPDPSATGQSQVLVDPVPVPIPGQTATGLQYLEFTSLTPGATFNPGIPQEVLGSGGTGIFSVNGNTPPPNSTFSVTQVIQAIATGVQQYTATVIGNPNVNVGPIVINVLGCPNITASNAAFTGCNNMLTGDLAPYVSGGSAPYSFSQAGVTTCDDFVILNGSIFTFSGPVGFTGCTFQYDVIDNNGCNSNIGTVTLTTSEGPVASNSSGTVCENSTLVGGILIATGGTPPYTFAIVTNGTLGTAVITDATTGTFNYTPNPNTSGIDTFTFSVTDSASPACTSNVATVTINIFESPSGTPVTVSGCVNSTVSGNLVPYVSGGMPPYGFISTGTSVGGNAIIGSAGPFTFTPNAGFSGAGSFGYQITDASGCFGTGAVGVTIASPTTLNVPASACVDGSVMGSVSDFVDGGFGGPYTFSSTGTITCGTAFVSPTGAFSFIPNPGFSGICSFQYQVTDIQGCSATGLVNVDVSSPVANSSSGNLCLNGATAGNLLPLVSGGRPDYVFSTTGATVGGVVTINPTGPFSFTASSGFSGNGGFVYQVTDENDCSATGAVNLAIRSPIANSESGSLCAGGATAGNLSSLVTSGFLPYTFSATGAPVGGIVTVHAAGPFNYTANIGFSGHGGFVYQVTDSNHCTATGAVNLTISSPVAASASGNLCVNSATAGNLSPLVSGGLLPYTFSATGAPIGGIVTVNSAGPFNFTANAGFSGSGGFVYQVTDGNTCTATGAVTLAIRSPIAGTATQNLCTNGETAGNLNGLVTSGFPAYTFTLDGGPVGGIVTINPAGPFNFTASPGFTGSGGFGYEVTDSNHCTATGAVNININSHIANNASANLCLNGETAGNLSGLVVGGVMPYTFTLDGGPVGGIVTVNPSGPFNFTASPGFSGLGGFGYQVVDANACTATGEISVTVSSPIASSALGSICGGSPTAGNLIGLVTSGFVPYTFSPTGVTLGGTVVIAPTGPFTFTPSAGFNGTGGFSYQVTDSNTCTATGAFDFRISSLIAGSISGSICVNGETAGNLSGLVADGVPPYIFSATGTPVGGIVTVGSSGPYEFMANPGFSGNGGFVYQVADSGHCVATGAVDLIVSSPTITPGLVNACLNGATAGNLNSFVTGLGPFTFFSIGSPTGGIVTINPAGPFNFTANAGFSGNGGFGYQVQDGNHCVQNGAVNVFVDNLVASSMSFSVCSSAFTGTLTDFVLGGSGTLTFTGPLGPLTCTGTSVTIATGGDFTYTGPVSSTAPCSFNYGVGDAIGCSSTGTLTISSNIAPMVINGTIRTCNSLPVTSTLANFVIGTPPPPLTYIIVTSPTHGTISNFNASTGAFTYTPNAGYVGMDSFQFQLLEGTGCFSNIATITVAIPCCPPTDPFAAYVEQIYWNLPPS